MVRRKSAARKEPTIALINVVFLMLIFFMIAGTLAPPLDSDLSLVETSGLEAREPPDTLIIHPDGRLSLRGRTVESVGRFLAELPEDVRQGAIRVVPDRELPAADLVRIGGELRAAGAAGVLVVTERALQ
ncbi:ExbD/TolR family protein [Tropicimonas aquimaris]|uniref:ExbD/TolR family protein n=1 Tax=Tropicimonas aquimaris TaxID=914152 RepID=A0ABW3IXH3_9RHOB